MSEVMVWALGGAGVGLLIGLTGVGGGSVMTPFLAYLGMPLPTAVGTDLMYATITKSGGVWTHQRQGTIRWNIVFLLGMGSLPASIATSLVLKSYIVEHGPVYVSLIKHSLGVMMILTAALLIVRNPLIAFVNQGSRNIKPLKPQQTKVLTTLVGIVIGVLVTLSSVGAGVLGTSALLFLYSRMRAVVVIGTELAHAIPLTLVAGLGHWLLLGNVNFSAVGALLIGSLPAVYLGARLSSKVPHGIMRAVLITLLGIVGTRYLLVN
jgi:uncharacterized membrane protein YfcA